jgi:hypothetical protein
VAGRGDPFDGRLLHMTTNDPRSRPKGSNDTNRRETSDSTEFWLANSRIKTERGAVGTILRVDRFTDDGYTVEYAGPTTHETLRNLEGVAWYVE